MLGNLLTNAIQFAPTGGAIDVEVFGPPLSEDAVGVSVHNAGEPIAPEDRERIFEPFSASSRRVGGTALGLSISRTIVEAHGGRIWVESGAERHEVRVHAAGRRGRRPTRRSRSAIEPTPRRRGLGDDACALVVDDDPRRALLLKGLLMSLDRPRARRQRRRQRARASRAPSTRRSRWSPARCPTRSRCSRSSSTTPTRARPRSMVVGEAERRADLLAAGADDLLEFPIQPAVFRDACLRARRERPSRGAARADRRRRPVDPHDLPRGARAGGYQVRDAGSATAALAEARRFRPDLILLDVMMPGIDGYRTAEMIRADAAIGMTPIIFLSARGDTADKVRAFRSRRRGLHGQAVRRGRAARARRQGARSPGARARRLADDAAARRRRDRGRDRAPPRRRRRRRGRAATSTSTT